MRSPMMSQYFAIKERNPDCIVFFRLGDFYEMFYDDAQLVAGLLNITLTARDAGDGQRAPMCGVPYHSANTYIKRLSLMGHKIAIAEQMTDPKESRGLVEREVVRIITPGTFIDDDDAKGDGRYIMSLALRGTREKRVGIAYAYAATGEFKAYEIDDIAAIGDELARISPLEIIAAPKQIDTLAGFAAPYAITAYDDAPFMKNAKPLLKHFTDDAGSASVSLVTRELPLAASAASGLTQYLMETQLNAMRHINKITVDDRNSRLVLGRTQTRNLEIAETISGDPNGRTLLWLLDRTVTSMGGREIRDWVLNPLCNLDAISARHDAVAELAADGMNAQELRDSLKGTCDFARLAGKLSYKTFGPKDALSLAASLEKIPTLRDGVCKYNSRLVKQSHSELTPMSDILNLTRRMVSPDAPADASQPGVIADGYNAELDEYRRVAKGGVNLIGELEARERERTGIRTLRVVYSRVAGYLIELTKANAAHAPSDYKRRQTMTNAERYTTDELTNLERDIEGAKDKAARLERELFASYVAWLTEQTDGLIMNAEAIARLDALLSLAHVAVQNDYVRPTFNGNGTIDIKNGRHPIVERMLSEPFIPNDTRMDAAARFHIITGPNMAGKSTYMRQLALIVIMAQMGSFVPCESADLCVVDRLFTRVGASDDIANGRSTFMQEMVETAQILGEATERSLILLDEIGRGTATFDGLSIAWAVTEYIAEKIRAKTMFATHYHELSALEGKIAGVVNYHAKVRDYGDSLVFLRVIERGDTDKSFGVHAASLAGLPKTVVNRARTILAKIEAVNSYSIDKHILGENKAERANQLAFHETERAKLIEDMRSLDVTNMTPMQALTALYTLHEKALLV